MYYLIFYEVVLNLVFLAVIFISQKKVRKLKAQIAGLNEEKNRLSLKYNKEMMYDQRSNFRLELQKEAKLFIESIDGDKDGRLTGKMINGNIENISVSGIKFTCPYSLPVESNIMVKCVFTLGSTGFHLDAAIVRKEESIKKKQKVYGLKFMNVGHRELERLNVEIRKLDAQKRNKVTKIS
ncbi:PilZ domain-containing protein [Halobacillus salinus]|uniref:PilZ domain-containing protein n=1 Tax=Halobacillus salinus TaxID=192814 RepID=A0A4Z0GU84_9BACI|nr:PilZ domain-containing protein [Halobacillus salinus]TGB01226.1 PilZ domain-containing protein [Halobacillus salinus]